MSSGSWRRPPHDICPFSLFAPFLLSPFTPPFALGPVCARCGRGGARGPNEFNLDRYIDGAETGRLSVERQSICGGSRGLRAISVNTQMA